MRKRHFFLPLLLTLIVMLSLIPASVSYAAGGTPERAKITDIIVEKINLNCRVGEHPDSSLLPATARVSVEGREDTLMLPLEWDLSHIDFNTPGSCTLRGYLTKQGLEQHKLTNPEKLSVSAALQIYENKPFDNLQGRLLSTAGGYTQIKLTLPVLPMNSVQALYIYSSIDNVHWKQESWDDPSNAGLVHEEPNFLSLVQSEGRSSSLLFKYQSNGGPIWLRAKIAGSELDGLSNSIYLETTDLPEREIGTGGAAMGNSQGTGTGQNNGNPAFPNIPQQNTAKGNSTSGQVQSGSGSSRSAVSASKDSTEGGLSPDITTPLAPLGYGQDETVAPSAPQVISNAVDSGTGAGIQDGVQNEVQALTTDTQSELPSSKDQGTLLTVAAIVLAAGGLLLIRKFLW